MRRNLDAEWARDHPEAPPSEREIEWYGNVLVRKPDLPLKAFLRMEAIDPSSRQQVTPIIESVKECLEPESRTVVDLVIESEGVDFGRFMQLWQTLVEESTGRPTPPASDSSPGLSGNGIASTGGSPSTEAPTFAPSRLAG